MTNATKLKIVGPLAVIGGIVVIGAGYLEEGVAAKLRTEGVSAKGMVVGHEIQRGRRGAKTYKLRVLYPGTSGKTFTVSKSYFDSMREGEGVEIRHLASDPSESEIVGQERSGTLIMIGGAVATVIGFVLTFVGYKPGAVTG